MTGIVVITSQSWQNKLDQYLNMFLILQTAMNGIFLAQDMLLFFVFFEATLIPMLLCIGIWGSKDRAYGR